MKRFSIGNKAAVCAAIALTCSLVRAADDLPKADTLLDKFVEVTGGKAAYLKHHSEIEKGTMELPAMGIKAAVTAYRADGQKSLTETDLGAMGKMREGSDGATFWSMSMMGPQVKEGPELAQAKFAALNAEANWRDLFKGAKTTGTDTVDGKPCYKVELTPAEGPPVIQCYDKDSGLMVKMTMTAQTPMGEVTADSYASDYRKEDGVLIAHKQKTSAAGQEFVLTIDSVTFNSEIPEDKFALPAEVKALVKK